MEPDLGDLPFAVEFKLQLSQLSFGQHEGLGIIDPPSDFSELDILGSPVFFGRCFFGRNNLDPYKNFGINFQCHDREEARISDGIRGRVFNNDRASYSFALVYVEDETIAQVDTFLNPNIFEKIYLAKNAVNFQLVTAQNQNNKINEDHLIGGKRREPDNIIVEGEPGTLSTINKFTLDIGNKEFGNWWFRVRLVSLDFPSAEGPPSSKLAGA